MTKQPPCSTNFIVCRNGQPKITWNWTPPPPPQTKNAKSWSLAFKNYHLLWLVFKLVIQSSIKWDTQVDYMCKAFNKKLIFLRQLKRCNIPINDLRTVYLQYVRPTLENASPAWFCGLIGCLHCSLSSGFDFFRFLALASLSLLNFKWHDLCHNAELFTRSSTFWSLPVQLGADQSHGTVRHSSRMTDRQMSYQRLVLDWWEVDILTVHLFLVGRKCSA